MLLYSVKKLSEFSENDLRLCYECMCTKRKEQIRRYKNEKSKKSTLAGEWLARCMLADFLGKKPWEFKILPNESGKLYCENSGGVFFNISHSEELVAVAICDEEVGIDIEVFRPVSQKLIEKVCTKNELDHTSDAMHHFFEIWTAKEAYFKCLGTGINNLTKFYSLDTEFPKIKKETNEYVLQIVKKSSI